MSLSVKVDRPIEVGAVAGGVRRVIPIIGGHAQASEQRGNWHARVLPGGADFQLVADGTHAWLDARYVLELDGGERIYVCNQALRRGSRELVEKIARGEPVDPALLYFRCVPRFEVSSSALAWLTDRLFVGTGARDPDQVRMQFFELG